MHAIIEFAGKQYKVEEGRSIKVPFVKGKIGTKVAINNILYLEEGDKKTIGSPFVSGKKLNSEIVSHGRGRKVVVFKFKRRKGYQKKNTHRDDYTILKFGKFSTVRKQKAGVKMATTVSKQTSEKKEIVKKRTPKKADNKSATPKTRAIKKENTKVGKK